MGQINIIKRATGEKIKLFSKEPFTTVTAATQDKNLMGDDTVKLTVVSSQVLDLAKGDYAIIDGEEYTIRTPITRNKISSAHYEYEITLYGIMYELMKCLYRDTDANGKSSTVNFDLTYPIKDFVKVIVYNMNRDYPGKWTFDEDSCPDTDYQTISFSNQNCLQVLQTICKEDQFGVDFRITQANGVRTIHIGSFGDVITPPGGGTHFCYGKCNGLYQLKEDKVDDKAIKTRLWVEGGENNLKSGYRDYASRLQLPYPQRLNLYAHTLRDGTVVEAGSETIGISDDAKRYHEDADLADKIGTDEDYESYDDIYPQRTGTVTAIDADNVCIFCDSTMDFDLNEVDESTGETKYLIGSTTAKITFMSGKLAGQEFELKAEGGYDHASKMFTLIPYEDERGQKYPTEGNTAFQIAIGDTYKITDINMPDSYINKAEEELWYESIQDFNDLKQPRVKYTLTLDRIYMLNNTAAGTSPIYFQVGDYVPVKDERLGVEKIIRITKVSRNLLLSQDYTIEISDTSTISVFASTVLEVMDHENVIKANRLYNLSRAKKAWRTTEELRNMVYDTDGYFDGGNIRPNSIDTNMLTVGAKSQQFVLVDAVLEPNYLGDADIFKASAATLQHLTIDDDNIRSWGVSERQVSISPKTYGYYLFAKCSKTGDTGTWYVSTTQYKVEDDSDPDNYYFQVGIISSVNSGGFRDFVTTYGFTRINGNTITTGKIVTSDGQCYLDLDGNKFRIGDNSSSVDWNVTAENQLTLHNVRLLSSSGDTSTIGVYRGTYNASYTYYNGDEVAYTVDNCISLYRQISQGSCTGVVPTNTTYWQVVAQGSEGSQGPKGDQGEQGAQGEDGDFCEYRYAVNGSTTTAPSIDASIVAPSGWSTTMPTVGSGQYLWCTVARKSGDGATLVNPWSTPVRMTSKDGSDGKSPAMVYRGEYDSTATYYGNDNRRDAVKYNGTYYIARIDAGEFAGVTPTSTDKWITFGAQFENIATDLLLADQASIGNWRISGGNIVSTLDTSDVGKVTLDAENGKIQVYAPITPDKGQSSISATGVNIKMDANEGVVSVRDVDSHVSEVSAKGMFANYAGSRCTGSYTGATQLAAIVALGRGDLDKQTSANPDTEFVAGVYGEASNTGTAPCYGGYFRILKATGLILNAKIIESTDTSVELTDYNSYVIGCGTGTTNVYLPQAVRDGQTVFIKQWWTGKLVVYAPTGYKLYNDSSEDDKVSLGSGEMAICVYLKRGIGGTDYGCWLINRLPYN